MNNWRNCKKILCIRTDNMGDVIMSSPAFRALKESFNCHITLLTSSMGNLITPCIKEIDNVIVYNVPWTKTEQLPCDDTCFALVKELQSHKFEGAIIFTVYSQSALPAAVITMMAGIPLRLAYCRENPYNLLTDWVPDKEPYSIIYHQVERDLKLVAHIGAQVSDDALSLVYSEQAQESAIKKLDDLGVDTSRQFIILHPGVSEKKRQYPVELWGQTGLKLADFFGRQIIITGSDNEQDLADEIKQTIGDNAFSAAGKLSVEEFVAVIDEALFLISVNTSSVHIAAALQTPSVVLYALTNPQHIPWKNISRVLPLKVRDKLKSKNEVVKYVSERLMINGDYPSPGDILEAAKDLLLNKSSIPSMPVKIPNRPTPFYFQRSNIF
jgi:ADP-heptose:LPS heptosyltransferase